MSVEPAQVSATNGLLQVLDLGLVDYQSALNLQTELRDRRIAGRIPDTLILLEHPPVITLGRSGNLDNVLVPESDLSERGIRLIHTNRGGDVTYHGPGQIVGYAILDLTRHGTDLRKHLWKLEEVLICTLTSLGITGTRRDGETGVWVAQNKIASIGIHVKRWVTMHGLALNLAPNFDHLSLINHCGITDAPMTSIQKTLSIAVPPRQARHALKSSFSQIFNLTPINPPNPLPPPPEGPPPPFFHPDAPRGIPGGDGWSMSSS